MTTPTYRHYGAEPFKPEADDDLIVCRCEEVTKGDIRQAVHQGLYRFPEIRRFERCGMGVMPRANMHKVNSIHSVKRITAEL